MSRVYRPDPIERAAANAFAVGQPDPPERPPLVGADIWQEVVSNADGQCECQRCTARGHRVSDGRCWVRNSARRPLSVVPRDPAGEIAAMRLPAHELIALCENCRAAADSKVKRDKARAALEGTEPMFGLELYFSDDQTGVISEEPDGP